MSLCDAPSMSACCLAAQTNDQISGHKLRKDPPSMAACWPAAAQPMTRSLVTSYGKCASMNARACTPVAAKARSAAPGSLDGPKCLCKHFVNILFTHKCLCGCTVKMPMPQLLINPILISINSYADHAPAASQERGAASGTAQTDQSALGGRPAALTGGARLVQ